MIAVVYGDLKVEVEAEELQLLRRRLLERQDTLARSGDAATAIERGLPDGEVCFEHHQVMAVGEVLGELQRERRLIEGLRRLYRVLIDEMDRDLGGERGAD